MIWLHKTFAELTTHELYDILQLRNKVFIVEQTCYYPDTDDVDKHPEAIHLMLYNGDSLIAYSRILPKGTSYENYPSIGRVIIEQAYRGTGIAKPLMEKSIALCESAYGPIGIKISAQSHLQAFYQGCGFNVEENHIKKMASTYSHG